MFRTIFCILIFGATTAYASGPVAPNGWNGSYEPVLQNGQQCCFPADLNGTGLTGGAFVLLSDDKKEFAIYALTYTLPLMEHWYFIEKHPIAELTSLEVTIEPRGQYPFGGIKVCSTKPHCIIYYSSTENGSFKHN